eukprot:m.106220 g.106220  ORF g.106220 m.106220 type:complete len:372 (+) comp15143_c1_seq1:84-1199(+)
MVFSNKHPYPIISCLERLVVEESGEHGQRLSRLVLRNHVAGTRDGEERESLATSIVGGDVTSLDLLVGLVSVDAGPWAPGLLLRETEFASPFLRTPVGHTSINATRVDDHAVLLSQALVQGAKIGSSTAIVLLASDVDMKGSLDIGLSQPLAHHSLSTTDIVVQGTSNTLLELRMSSKRLETDGGKLTSFTQLTVDVGESDLIVAALVVDVVNVKVSSVLVHLGNELAAVRSLCSEVTANILDLRVQSLGVHAMAVEELNRDTISLSSKTASGNLVTNATITDSSTLEVEATTRVNGLHDLRNVDTGIALASNVEIVALVLGESSEESLKEVSKLLTDRLIIVDTLNTLGTVAETNTFGLFNIQHVGNSAP